MPLTITTPTTVTAQDLITRACRALGYLGRTATLKAADAVDGIISFNTLLDSWSNEGLMAYVTTLSSFPLVIGQQVYTIGQSGSANINAARPYDILQAFVRDSNNNDYPLHIVPQNVWNNIGLKTITSQIPTTLFYQTTYPDGQINIFPIPLTTYTVFYVNTLNQVPFSLLTQPLAMPLGYERAFVLNLALELMSVGYPCLLDDKRLLMLVENAREAKGNVKRSNMKEVISDFDPAIISRSLATYNIYSDSNPRR